MSFLTWPVGFLTCYMAMLMSYVVMSTCYLAGDAADTAIAECGCKPCEKENRLYCLFKWIFIITFAENQ